MNLTLILVILLALATAGDAILAKLYVGAKEDLATMTQKFNGFVAQVKVAGNKQEAEAKAKMMADKLAKDTADAENAATVSRLNGTIGRLRADADRARGGLLPAAPAGSRRPDLACFDRAEYQRADGIATEKLYRGARGLADEGTAATVALDTGKRWAQGVK